jgi:hypothetical protein
MPTAPATLAGAKPPTALRSAERIDGSSTGFSDQGSAACATAAKSSNIAFAL